MVRPDDDIHFCVISGRAVLLDLRRNRYFALPAGANTLLLGLVGEQGSGTMPQTTLDRLMAGVTGADLILRAPKCLPAPTDDRAAAQAEASASLWLIAIAWLATIFAKLMVRLVPLSALLRGFERHADRHTRPTSHNSTDRIGAAFRKLGLLIAHENNCLPLTLAFVWLCRLYGYHPTLIIGVRINPFSAHCWSQHGAIVLNDTCDRVRPYQPILFL